MLLLTAAGCKPPPTTEAPVQEGCSGARCVEEAEAALYYNDPEKAREPLAVVCAGGDGFQCLRLAELHQHGRGGPVDMEKALHYYVESCEKGHGQGCERRAELARTDHGGPAVELEFETKACAANRPEACTRAGTQLSRGRGVEPDIAQAIKIFQSGCKQGEITSCTGAGDLLADPSGTNEAKAQSLAAFISACVGHSGYGCLKVALALHEGLGVPKNPESARIHFKRACDFANDDGCHALKQLDEAGGKPVTFLFTTKAPEIDMAGLFAKTMSCRMVDQGLPALEEVLDGVAGVKSALDACAKEGLALEVTWEFAKGRVHAAALKNEEVPPKLEKCVTGALRKAKVEGTGDCSAVLLFGDPAGAAKALEARAQRRRVIRVSHDDEG